MDSGRQVGEMVLLSLIVVIRFLLLLSIDIVVVRVVVAMLKKEDEIGIVPGCVMMLGGSEFPPRSDTFPSTNKFWVPILDSLFPTYRAVPRAGEEFYRAVEVPTLLGKFVSVEDDAEGLGHAIVDRKMNEHTAVHCSKDIEEVKWNFLNFGEKNLVACGCMDLICKLGIEADSIVSSQMLYRILMSIILLKFRHLKALKKVFDKSLISNVVVSDDRIMCRQTSDRGEPRSAARGGTLHKVLSIEAPVFILDELNRIIGNFGQKALVGEGSYDRIYCAKLSNGKQVTIKKLDTSSSPELDSSFAAQLSTVSRLKNEHFMTLMGYCLKGNNRILVYEFATKGSLHDVYMIISWRTCLKFPDEPKVSDEAKDLICHLLYDVESRLGTEGVEEIKVHSWFKGVNWDMLYEMEAAYKPIVTRELDTQNFEKFQPDDHEDLQPSDAASRPISPMDARRSRDDNDPNDIL
ncbi:hypothetical protein CQW23_22589 [Capsicum baccatum]|uniref:Protein kinase domain-containing protein n=1 Tax=Capsicum baccatum TaxID=33114 RepID=A0A2G2W1A9_CAPBA|nr:hypothetical protein CQW23_22589 [Capsicum baccatum]